MQEEIGRIKLKGKKKKNIYTDDDFRALGLGVAEKNHGMRLDAYLAANYPFLSRPQWKARISDSQVKVNGRVVRASFKLQESDQICYYRPQSDEPEVDDNIKVIWEKEGVMAVYKPSNLPMHEGGRFRKNTFSEVIRNKIGEEWAAIHRLDRETSGIVLCAADKNLRNKLSAEFRERTMSKTYLAIARGVPEKDEWIIDAPIGEAKETTFRLKKWVEEDGLPSVTSYKILDKTDTHCLLQVSPKTGRTHQIRVHSAWYGLPLVGEKKYYPDETVYIEYMDHGLTERVVRLSESERLCLHATSLVFRHPVSEEVSLVDSPMPEDMAVVWERLKNKKAL